MELREPAAKYLASDSRRQTEIGELPASWSVRSLSELTIKIGSGKTPAGGSARYRSHGRPFVRSQNVAWGDLQLDDLVHIDEATHSEFPGTEIADGDVLLNITGASIGRSAVADSRIVGGNVNQHVCIIRTTGLGSRLTNYFLLSPIGQRQIDSFQAGGNREGLNFRQVGAIKLPCPPSQHEQQAIAEALSDADAIIESLSLLLVKKRQIKQGTMQELLTGKKRLPGFSGKWEAKVLGQSASLKARIGWQGLTTKEYLDGGDYYLVTGTELHGGEINWDECNHVDAARYKQDVNIQLQIDDVLVTKDGTIGKVGIVTTLPKPATLNSGVFVIRPATRGSAAREFHPKFFYYLLCSSVFTDFLEQLAAGSTINHLYQKDFVKFVYHLPPTADEQQAIAHALTDMDTDISEALRKLAKAHQLKQGMMQALLTGRIRLIQPTSNVIPLPIKPAPTQPPPPQPAHNWQINEAVVIGALAQRFGSDKFPLPRKRRVKLMYLLHRHAEGRAEGYLKKAAGPYDPNTKYKGPEAIALKNSYVRTLRNGTYEGFVAGDKVEQAQRYFEQWYGTAALDWLERFHYRKTDDLELLATVDMAMVDLAAAGQPANVPGVKRVIAAHPEWVLKLSRELFSDEKIARAIAECATLFTA